MKAARGWRCTHSDPPHLRILSCCKSEPECPLCPLLPQNAHRSLKELAEAGLRGNLPEAGVA